MRFSSVQSVKQATTSATSPSAPSAGCALQISQRGAAPRRPITTSTTALRLTSARCKGFSCRGRGLPSARSSGQVPEATGVWRMTSRAGPSRARA